MTSIGGSGLGLHTNSYLTVTLFHEGLFLEQLYFYFAILFSINVKWSFFKGLISMADQ